MMGSPLTGATTVSESYGDWTMTCVRPREQVACVVAHSWVDLKFGRHAFGVELKPLRGSHAESVVTPFGLALEPGITFKLDEQVLGKGAPYSNCTGESCLVLINFPMVGADAMRTDRMLTVMGEVAARSTRASRLPSQCHGSPSLRRLSGRGCLAADRAAPFRFGRTPQTTL